MNDIYAAFSTKVAINYFIQPQTADRKLAISLWTELAKYLEAKEQDIFHRS